MAKSLIDTGINLNDGTGDNLRTAGTKINNMFTEIYDVFGDGTNLSNLAEALHIVNDVAPQLGGNLDTNGRSITGSGAINIYGDIQTSNELIAAGGLEASTATITNNSTFGGAVTIAGVTTGTIATFAERLTTGTLTANTELTVTGPARIDGAINSIGVGSKMRFYWNNVAAFPSAATYEGGLAFAEDTNRMYFASDTNWLSLAPELDPVFTGTPLAPTASKNATLGGQNTTQVATLAYVKDVTSDYAPLASPALTGNPTAPTPSTADADTSIATTGHVWANRNELQANIDLKAPLASPALTGTPTTTTQTTGTRDATGASTQIANSTYVRNVAAEIYNLVDLKAPIASPALTGTPTVPTATAGTNTTQIANTLFVTDGIGSAVTTINSALTLKAPLNSPELTGTPVSPTPGTGDNSTKISTTAFVKTAIDARFSLEDLSQYAKLNNPVFIGTPVAPTPVTGDNTTKISTTAFVKAAIDTRFSSEDLSQYARINSQVFTGTPTVPTPSENNNTLQISNTAFVQNWTYSYGDVPKWGGSRKYVSTAAPTTEGVNGDIWFQYIA